MEPKNAMGHGSITPQRNLRVIRISVFVTWLLILGIGAAAHAESPFAIRDGDRIVFYGDSITDQRLYTTHVETYIVTRFPALNVAFVHSGWGGDRVTGGGGGPIDRRLERDVFAYKPTVVTVMLGMNDASYRPFNQPIFDVYAKGYQHLVQSLKDHLPGVRLTLIVPSPYDDVTRKPTFEGGYNQVLLRYGEFVRSLAGKEGATVADLNTSVVAGLKKAFEIDPRMAQFLIFDRVHPGPAGQLLMAEALLKAWNAPAVVSTVEIDATTGNVVKHENTHVDELKADGTISWTQLDSALPMPIDLKDPTTALAVRASDVEQALNQQILRVSSLKNSRYQLKIDGRDVAELTREQLAAGVNLAEHETPMFGQARVVHAMTLQHNTIHFQRWREVQLPFEGQSYPSLAKVIGDLDALEAELVEARRAKAKPVPHRYELIPK
ncbi:MAG: SGNH/GDSL hydrolase family protein [Isosphaeraceae bacterium]